MKTTLMILSALVLTTSQNAEAQVDKARLVSAMTTLERAYIAALVTTNEGKAEPSRKAMARLDSAWQTFRGQEGASLETQKGWASGLAEVEKHLKRADEAVAQGAEPAKAHGALEPIRMVLMELRRHDGIDFFPDDLTAFHEPMEVIATAAEGRTPSTLSQDDLGKIRKALPEAKALWQRVLTARLDEAVFGFDAEKSTAKQALLRRESEALAKLERALGSNDAAQIIPAAAGIKQPFSRLYKLFGDTAGLE